MKFLSKGTTGKIVEDADEKRATLLKTFKVNINLVPTMGLSFTFKNFISYRTIYTTSTMSMLQDS